MAKSLLRLRAIQLAFGIGVVALLGRAAQVQLLEGPRHAATARAQRTERVELTAGRGALYDRNGTPLVLSQEMFHVGVAPNELRDRRRDGDVMADRLGLDRGAVHRQLTRRYAYFHGPFMSTQVQPLRALRGVHLTAEVVRFYPDPGLARSVLGRPAADGRPASGLERVLDTLLTGTDGSAVVLRDRQGRRYESPARLDAFPVAGHDAYLTIDAELQEIVEQALKDAIEGFGALRGDVVVLNPRTGEILAIASRTALGPAEATAFTTVFEPGSTAKLFAAAAILTHDLAHPDDSVWAERGMYKLGGRTIRDDHPHEWLTLRGVLERSSNIGMVKFSRVLTRDQQFAMLRDFGLGTQTGVEYPAESGGILKQPHQWSGATAASLAMGYEVAVTPLQLAQAYAAIANDGVLVQPTLVREIRSPSGRVVYRHIPEPVRRVVRPEVAAELRAMLRGVVYRGGTGSTAALSTYEVAGKTGTARRAGPRGYIPGSYTASFASLFPADDPQLVMVVKLDDPERSYAQLTAAPVTKAVLEQLLAARTGALDHARLTVSRSGQPDRTPVRAHTSVQVLTLPLRDTMEAGGQRTVPDVRGLSLRDAARELHKAGLRVVVRGWGSVLATDPPTGTSVLAGTVVSVLAADKRPVP